jgi:antitoxin component YwqK of YwqJK toxin-antitoxin module
MTLIKSFQPFGRGPTTERIDSKHSKTTVYYKTGEVQAVFEFVNGKVSKATYYHKTGEVKDIVYPPPFL